MEEAHMWLRSHSEWQDLEEHGGLNLKEKQETLGYSSSEKGAMQPPEKKGKKK